MKIGYADPPYISCAHLYKDHPDYAGEVDHAELIARLERDYDGWILHASATATSMRTIAALAPDGARWCSWVKGFAAFKANVPLAYAWEPIIVKPARDQVVGGPLVMRDWIECPITMKRGFTGAKPEKVCWWAFAAVGAEPGDDLDDMFPGSGAVLRAWHAWQANMDLFGAITPEEKEARETPGLVNS